MANAKIKVQNSVTPTSYRTFSSSTWKITHFFADPHAGTWSQDIHRTRFNFPSFQVLTVTTKSKAHVDNMVAAFQLLARQVMPVWDKPCPGRIFLFAERASADPHKLLGYAWVNGNGVSRTFEVPSPSP